MIQFCSVKHQFSKFEHIEFADFKAGKGDHYLITGNSGSGKTTLLHIAGGLLSPTEGEVIIGETLIYKLKPFQLDSFRGKNIGVIYQQPHLIKSLSVIENVLAALYFAGKKPDTKKAEQLLSALDLSKLKNKKPFALSQGQAQRVAVARAVINEPAVILADEPTSSLDDENSLLVTDMLKQTAQSINAVLLITSHDNRIKPQFQNIIHLKMQKAQ